LGDIYTGKGGKPNKVKKKPFSDGKRGVRRGTAKKLHKKNGEAQKEKKGKQNPPGG